jgi:aerobic-type carbon monoxide dehydrogenase small subunit (CoxS/CutS family)
MSEQVHFQLNGRPTALDAGENRMLLWALRTDAGVTGPKYGCGAGFCGACTVLLDGQPTRSCSTPLEAVAGKSVVTIEGLAQNDKLHPLQEAFIDHGAFQCGYCTSGMILTAYAFLKASPHPTRGQIAENLESNFCRCAAHNRILDAVEAAAKAGVRS